MGKPWREVEQGEGYQALGANEQKAAKTEYFDMLIAPQVPEADRDAARQEFFTSTAPEPIQPQAPQEELEFGEAMSQAVQNFPEGASDFMGQMADMFRNPKETVEAMSGAVFGLMETLTPSPTPEQQKREEVGDLIKGALRRQIRFVEEGEAFSSHQTI